MLGSIKTQNFKEEIRSAEISAKGPPFHFLLFYRNLQNRTRLKGSIFFRHCATFFENFLMSQYMLTEYMLIKPEGSPFTFFGTMRHFLKEKNQKF